MPVPIGPQPHEHDHVARLDAALLLIAAMASFSRTNTRAGPSMR